MVAFTVFASDADSAYEVWKTNAKAASDATLNIVHGAWTLCPQCAEDVAVFAAVGLLEIKRY